MEPEIEPKQVKITTEDALGITTVSVVISDIYKYLEKKFDENKRKMLRWVNLRSSDEALTHYLFDSKEEFNRYAHSVFVNDTTDYFPYDSV